MELQQKSHQFSTNTDTEVLLAAYIEWGEECVHHFNGMWAFVIFDKQKNCYFASRDRFGVKPFYYFQNTEVFAFASEIKALVNLPFVSKKINNEVVFDFFVSNKLEAKEETMVSTIFELFPATNIIINTTTNEIKKYKYYQLKVNSSDEKFDKAKANLIESKTRNLLIDAVSLRMRSDVAVGSCLSGGIDSSAIVGIMNALNLQNRNNTKLQLFTASFLDKNIDESKWAQLVANCTNSQWNQTFPSSSELLIDLENLIYSQDLPIWSTSTYAQHRVMKCAKEIGIKVLLDGQGGDELFGGYPHHLFFQWLKKTKRANFFGLNQELKMAGYSTADYFRLFKNSGIHSAMNLMPENLQMKFNKVYFNDLHFLNNSFLTSTKRKKNEETETNYESLNDLLADEFIRTRLKVYLKCEDRASMWHSVESRTPFADDINLIEYAFQIPSSFKTHGGISKYILRNAMKDFLPLEIKNRKDKMGYVTPNSTWLKEIKNELKPLFNEQLKDYMNVEKLNKNFDSFIGLLDKKEGGRIFKYISFALWKKAYKL
jgi:asparagine synthase (glutamine-hydrolysing)